MKRSTSCFRLPASAESSSLAAALSWAVAELVWTTAEIWSMPSVTWEMEVVWLSTASTTMDIFSVTPPALSLVREEPKSASVAAEPGPEELDAQYKFSTKFSLWAKGRELAEDAEIEAEAPVTVYLIAPLGLCLLIGLLAWLLLQRSFGTDPIYLLSTRETK